MLKSTSPNLLMALAACLALPAGAATATMDSIYTSLEAKDCKTLASSGNETDSYHGRCPGTAGFRLDLLEGDLRQTLNVVTPNGKEFPLELWSTVSSGFSSLGSKAEWRIKRNGGKADPIALIVRYNVSEDPATPTKITSYLVVSKISTGGICVTDIVKPGKDANQQARDLADAVADKTCLNHGGEPAESSTPRSLIGAIVGYECGDNCYLSIRDQQGKEHTGLCAAPLCDDWNNAAAMPDSFKGKQVTVTIGDGEQYDASGNPMGVMDAFKNIELLK